MTLHERAKSTFGESRDRDFALTYLGEVYSNWRAVEQELRRTVGLVVLFAITFELIASGAATEGTIGFVKLDELHLVQLALPVAISFLVLSATTLALHSAALNGVTSEALRAAFPAVFKHDFEYALTPPSVFYALQPLNAVYKNSRNNGFIVAMGASRLAVTFLGPIAFVLYAYYRLLRQVEIPAVAIGVSFMASLFFIFISIVSFISYRRQADESV